LCSGCCEILHGPGFESETRFAPEPSARIADSRGVNVDANIANIQSLPKSVGNVTGGASDFKYILLAGVVRKAKRLLVDSAAGEILESGPQGWSCDICEEAHA
jgi:hypothetical protein